MKSYLVGGAVRDQLLGLPVSDRDYVVVGATPTELKALGYRQVGAEFPVFLHPHSGEEYALARTERKQGHGYHGFSVDFSPEVTLEEDLLRRDLTINAMAEDEHGHIVDPFHGRDDLQAGILRHVSPAFREDPLRILRVARFAARFCDRGFHIAAETMALLQQMVASGEIDHLVAERVCQEWDKAFRDANPDQFIVVLRKCGALNALAPELEELFQQSPDQPPGDATLPSTGDRALAALRQVGTQTRQPSIRFATLSGALREDKLGDLCERLSVPGRWRELALLVSQYKARCDSLDWTDKQELLKLLEALDGLRRPQRVEDFLLACEAHALAQQATGYPPKQLLLSALDIVRSVSAKPLVEQGLSGIEIKNELNRLRLEALSR